MQTFTTIELVLLFVTLGYGVVLGINNTIGRIVGLFNGSTRQSQLGQLLDVLFYASIGYLTYTYFGFTV
jgi:hypothetical protein